MPSGPAGERDASIGCRDLWEFVARDANIEHHLPYNVVEVMVMTESVL